MNTKLKEAVQRVRAYLQVRAKKPQLDQNEITSIEMMEGSYVLTTSDLLALVDAVRVQNFIVLHNDGQEPDWQAYAELERQHLGDPDKKTGIYSDDIDAGQLPCPFCGSDKISAGEVLTDSELTGETVTQSCCMDCGALGPGAALADGEVDYGDVKAMAAWNRRPTPAQATPKGAQDERALFEAWARERCKVPAFAAVNWSDPWAIDAWEVWQARAAIAASQKEVRHHSMPERDTTKPAEQQGIFRKFDVRRVDGSDVVGGNHYGCNYFVLDLTHDKHAPAAMRAYAQSCQETHPMLAHDIAVEFGAQSTPAKPEPVCCNHNCNQGRDCPRRKPA